VSRIVDFFTASIQRKMLSSFTIVIVLVLVMVIGGFYQLNKVRSSASEIPEDSSQLAGLQNLALGLASLEANLERFFVIGGAQFQEDIYRDLETMTAAFEAQEEFADETDDELAMAEVEKKLSTLATEIDGLVGADYAELSSRETNQKIISIYSQIDSLKELAQALSAEELEQLQASAREQETIAANVITQFLVLGSLAVLIVVGASVVVTRSIATPLAGLAATASQIATGDLEAKVPVVKQKDEVGQLSAAFKSMTDQLRGLITTLEERVTSRTQRLETVATLSERLNAILDFDQLLLELVHQVKDTFGYYHAHVYVIDEESQKLVMAAGAGEAGQQMKARGHSIALDAPTSLVARTVRRNEIVSVDNVREAPDWLPNPLLPDTYSEMAVPIVLEGQVVGVLDVQQDEVAGLDEGDANLLRSLANQVAVAIRNARLFAQVETALADAQAAQERYIEQSWQKTKTAMRHQGQHLYADPDAGHIDEAKRQAMLEARQQARKENQPTVVAAGEEDDEKSLVAPIKLRDQKIGAVQLYSSRPDQSWSEDDLAVIEAVVDQLADTAESMRLFEETRERASFESLVGEITDRLRQAPTLDSLAKTAAEALGNALGVSHSLIKVGVTPPPEHTARNGDIG